MDEFTQKKIDNLARTLRSSGIAHSDSQAKSMAEEMVAVEKNVQRGFEEQHSVARDALDKRGRTVDEEMQDKGVFLEKVKTDVEMDNRPLNELMEDKVEVVEAKPEVAEEKPQLDMEKLKAMIEEDTKEELPETTKEIKGKPAVIKPKEEYEENNIDLSNMFNYGKR